MRAAIKDTVNVATKIVRYSAVHLHPVKEDKREGLVSMTNAITVYFVKADGKTRS